MSVGTGLGRRKVLRIYLPYLFQLSDEIEPLAALPDADANRVDIFFTLMIAEHTIRSLIEQSLYAPYLRSSYILAHELLGYLKETGTTKTDPVITRYELWQIKDCWNRYKIALRADFGALEAYFVIQQGGYDTRTLTQAGEALFPADLMAKVPETLFDAREAAKCIAYAVPTAAGFHIFRVLESVLRKYYAHVTSGAAAPKVRNIGVYLNALRQAKKGDPVVLGALKQIADLHRNPLIHPQVVLTMDEALSAHGITRSAVTAMLAQMPVVPPTTSTALPAPPAS
jgi:hypothetical protein